MKGRREGGADRLSLISCDGTQENGLKLLRGSLDWILGKGSSVRGWSSTETNSPENWSWPQAC